MFSNQVFFLDGLKHADKRTANKCIQQHNGKSTFTVNKKVSRNPWEIKDFYKDLVSFMQFGQICSQYSVFTIVVPGPWQAS